MTAVLKSLISLVLVKNFGKDVEFPTVYTG